MKKDPKPVLYSTSNQNGILHIQIPNDQHAINTFNNVLIKALGVGNKFGLEKPQSKDFNDLRQKNAVGQCQPEKQKYKLTF